MEEKQQGPYAFPLHPDITDPKFAGMTLRDYFAAKALQSIMISENFNYAKTALEMSDCSYKIADAMLKQREL